MIMIFFVSKFKSRKDPYIDIEICIITSCNNDLSYMINT